MRLAYVCLFYFCVVYFLLIVCVVLLLSSGLLRKQVFVGAIPCLLTSLLVPGLSFGLSPDAVTLVSQPSTTLAWSHTSSYSSHLTCVLGVAATEGQYRVRLNTGTMGGVRASRLMVNITAADPAGCLTTQVCLPVIDLVLCTHFRSSMLCNLYPPLLAGVFVLVESMHLSRGSHKWAFIRMCTMCRRLF